MATPTAKAIATKTPARRISAMLNPFSWSLDNWFFALQVLSFALLGVTVAVGYLLSTRQAKEILFLKMDLAKQQEQTAIAQKHIAPRAPSTEFWDALRGKPAGVIVEIMRDTRADDGYALGSRIVSIILAEGWELTNPDIVELPPPPPLKGSDAGAFSDPPRYGYGIRIEAPEKLGDTNESPYRTLLDAFRVSGLDPITSGRANDLPENSLRIIIGRKEPIKIE